MQCDGSGAQQATCMLYKPVGLRWMMQLITYLCLVHVLHTQDRVPAHKHVFHKLYLVGIHDPLVRTSPRFTVIQTFR